MEWPAPARYQNAILAAKEVSVTLSAADDVLVDTFRSLYHGSRAKFSVPDIYYALGTPCDKQDWTIEHPSYQELDLSPMNAGALPVIGGHSPIFGDTPESAPLVEYLWLNVLRKHVEDQ